MRPQMDLPSSPSQCDSMRKDSCMVRPTLMWLARRSKNSRYCQCHEASAVMESALESRTFASRSMARHRKLTAEADFRTSVEMTGSLRNNDWAARVLEMRPQFLKKRIRPTIGMATVQGWWTSVLERNSSAL